MNKFSIFIWLVICITKADAQNASALHIGDSLYALGKYSQAIIHFKKTEDAEEKIARAYEALGNTTNAIHYYQTVLAQKKVGELTKYNYGKLLLKAGRHKTADSLFQRLAESTPDNPEFYYCLAIAKEKLRDSTAIYFFKMALKKDPNHQNALYKVAKHQAEKRSFEEAKAKVALGLEADPNNINFLNLKAIIAYVHKDYHNAASIYEKLLQLNQGNAQLHENLALSYNRTNRFEEAIAQYTILINGHDDKNPLWHYNIAKNFEALRYLEKAQHHFEVAIQLQDIPLDDSYIALASVFKKQKEFKKQFETLQKAVRENPENQRAKYLFATAADNYFKDDTKVIPYYEAYLKTFGEDGQYAQFAQQRIKDIKNALHFEKN
ncbi:tetratricopeptide repeat protein [Marinirhabdus gelatinilytica]|uniref:Tetratricopeptide repeat protein n=1 Tax=Marinirhabdus gelatinilytica TaxID=1703343 RepID=A0A370QKL9_9FLAO|nr:tetratricopeptide repeat protein [Marinirhabdus gelatinilytica]RDK88882.1 tetratricopeptide repeat protein [Marinirhabdus gelatinilytica]